MKTLFFAFVFSLLSIAAKADDVTVACKEPGKYIEAHTNTATLYLCDDSKIVNAYSVAIGWDGVNKKKDGDWRTPIGTYPLGEAHASEDFHLFLPIGYPTPEQKKEGYTGADVGIHGPKRIIAWLGGASVWVNWTRGCIAVSSDSEIEDIVNWVNSEKVKTIHIR